MIIEARKETITLTGELLRNSWLTIKAAVNTLLHTHPAGIIIDCAALTNCSEEGLLTFSDAVAHTQLQDARVIFCNLREDILQMIQEVPNVRSALPIAKDIEEAKSSLKMEVLKMERPRNVEHLFLFPIIEQTNLERTIGTICHLGKDKKAHVHLLAAIEVPRALPLDTPMPDEEKNLRNMLENVKKSINKKRLKASIEIARVRKVGEGIIDIMQVMRPETIIISVKQVSMVQEDTISEAVLHVMQRADCEVIVERLPGE